MGAAVSRPARPGRYFLWLEFERSKAARKHRLDNTVPDAIVPNIVSLCTYLLDPLREIVGPIKVTSGYRSDAVNRAVGGSPTSDHKRGWAVDIKAGRHSSPELARQIAKSGLPFDQMILYHPSRGGHVHLGGGPRMRGQMLYAPAGSRGYTAWPPST